jgi:hypothetical protein
VAGGAGGEGEGGEGGAELYLQNGRLQACGRRIVQLVVERLGVLEDDDAGVRRQRYLQRPPQLAVGALGPPRNQHAQIHAHGRSIDAVSCSHRAFHRACPGI